MTQSPHVQRSARHRDACARLIFRVVLVGIACVTSVSSAAAQSLSSDASIDARPDATGWGTAAGLRYLEIIRGGANPNEKLPLMIVIHGLGDKPHHDWVRAIDVGSNVKVRMILPQAPTPHGTGFAWFPYRAAGLDQAALAEGIGAAAERLTRMIEVLQKQRATRGRAVVTGFSQGGMLSFAVVLARPDLVECAVPISGMLPAPLWPSGAPHAGGFPRIRALHGDADTVVPFEADRRLIERLRELGYPAELATFEATGHTITPAMSALVTTALNEAFAPKKPPAATRRKKR